ncbi:MAG: twin-arginine translocation signal domain-containing protein, partial [Pseudomonadota bacterium]
MSSMHLQATFNKFGRSISMDRRSFLKTSALGGSAAAAT